MEAAEIERALAEPESYRFSLPAMRLVGRATSGADLAALVRERVLDGSVFTDNQPYFFRALISNSLLDAYWTRMAASSLRNYAAGAEQGVALLTSHDWRKLPVGYSLTGQFVQGGGERPARTEADFYIPRGVSPEGVNRDQLIDDIRGGVIRDVSIGFFGGRYMCSVCSRDMLSDMACFHIPGFSYKTEDGRSVVAEASIEDSNLAETSLVYDGACPNAGILKGYRMAQAGELDPQRTRLLEARYRVALPAAPRAFAGAATHPPTQEADMAESTTEATGQPTPEQRATNALGTATGTLTVTVDPREIDEVRAALDEATRTIEGATARVATLEAEVARLTPLAKDGERYRADLIDAALTEGVRALGDKLDRDQWAGMLGRMTLDEIRLIHEGWAGKAAERFPGGRLTVDEDEGTKQQPKRAAPAVPLGAYR